MLRRLASLLVAATLLLATSSGFAGDKKAMWERQWDHLLKKFDKNGDGQISKEEIEAVRAEEKKAHEDKKKTDEPKKDGDDKKDGDAKGDKKHHSHHRVNIVKDFDKIDTNKDGKISKEEFKAAWDAAEAAKKAEKGDKKDEPKPPEK